MEQIIEQEKHICSKCGKEFSNIRHERNNRIWVKTIRKDPNIKTGEKANDVTLRADLCAECEKDMDCKVREFINLLIKEFNFE